MKRYDNCHTELRKRVDRASHHSGVVRIFLNTLFIVPLLFFPQWLLDLFNIPLKS
jgi:hypothetical protein